MKLNKKSHKINEKKLWIFAGSCAIGVVVMMSIIMGISINLLAKGKEIRQGEKIATKPENSKWLFEHSDLIAYVKVISIDKKIKDNAYKKQPPGIYPLFEEQHCQTKVLKVLKGPTELIDKIISMVKIKSHYYLKEKQRLVLYLKKQDKIYRTIDLFGGEHRLASALCNINELKEDVQTGGIVTAVLNEKGNTSLRIHIIQGRHRATINIGDKIWKNYLFKILPIGKFSIAEIPLKEGNYTVLLELKGHLYPHSRLVEGYYPYVIIIDRKWKPLYFNINRIKNKNY